MLKTSKSKENPKNLFQILWSAFQILSGLCALYNILTFINQTNISLVVQNCHSSYSGKLKVQVHLGKKNHLSQKTKKKPRSSKTWGCNPVIVFAYPNWGSGFSHQWNAHIHTNMHIETHIQTQYAHIQHTYRVHTQRCTNTYTNTQIHMICTHTNTHTHTHTQSYQEPHIFPVYLFPPIK